MSFFLRQLFDPDEPETSGQRVQALVFESVLAARALYDLWSWAEIIPHQTAILAPTSIGEYLDVSFMLLNPWLPKLNAVLCMIFLISGITRRFSAAYACAFLSFAVQYAARFGLGKTQHATNMMGMAMLALAVSHLAFKREDLRRKAALGLIVAMFSVGYLLAAGSKLHARGLRWVRGENLWLWIREKRIDDISGGGRGGLNWLQNLALKNVHFATALLTFGLLSELSALLMWWRPARRWVMLSLAGMHLGIALVMKIYFTPNVLLLLALSLPVAEVVDRARSAGKVPNATEIAAS